MLSGVSAGSWFDADYTRVTARGEEPVIVPPQIAPATDIAFDASTVERERGIYLYCSVADQEMRRAVLRRLLTN